jgi:hypothetical protein
MLDKDDIIKMAREAGFNPVSYMGANLESFERFAALVAAHEREACAKLIESRKNGANELMDLVRDMEAQAIRARSEQ